MVSSLATKVHKTLHNTETDEHMVRVCCRLALVIDLRLLYLRCLSSPLSLMGKVASKNLSWDVETGVILNSTIGQELLCSIFGLRGRRVTVRQLGAFNLSISVRARWADSFSYTGIRARLLHLAG